MKLKLNTKIKHQGKSYKVIKGDCQQCAIFGKECKSIDCKPDKILKEDLK